MLGFYRIAAVSPRVVVADVAANLSEHLAAYRQAVENGASLVVFPELSLTGATCGDLFRQDVLLNAAWKAALELSAATAGFSDQFYFSRVFRKRRGMPPGKYRDLLRARQLGEGV